MSFDLSKMDKEREGNHPLSSLCWVHGPGFPLSWLLIFLVSSRQ